PSRPTPSVISPLSPTIAAWLSTSFVFSSSRRHTRSKRDWSSDVCSSDLFVIEIVIKSFVHNLDRVCDIIGDTPSFHDIVTNHIHRFYHCFLFCFRHSA